MNREEKIKNLITQKGYSIKSFANHIEMPYSTLLSMLNGSIGGASIDNVLKICKGLEISICELQEHAENKTNLKLSKKEEKLVIAYRQNPPMHSAVDKILGIEEKETVIIYRAARSSDNHEPEIIEMSKEHFEKIKNAPQTNEDLM